MINKLVIYNFHAVILILKIKPTRGFIFLVLPTNTFVDSTDKPESTQFLTKTQRIHFDPEEGYEFLLQVICGLKSKLLGENEIVGHSRMTREILRPRMKTLHHQVLQKLLRTPKY